MDVLAINGSQTKPRKSITNPLLESFLKGCKSAGARAETVHLAEKRVLPCDCDHDFACWIETPGKCVHAEEDDVEEILGLFRAADVVVLATPLTVEGMTWLMKSFLDRTTALKEPFVSLHHGQYLQRLRDMEEGKRFVALGIHGMYELSQLDIFAQNLERIATNVRGELVGKLLRPQGNFMRKPGLAGGGYYSVMDALLVAGQEVVRNGHVSAETEAAVSVPLCDEKTFVAGLTTYFNSRLGRDDG